MELIWLMLNLLGVVILAQISPGPDFVLVTRALGYGGMRAATRVSVGISLGLVFHCGIVFGLAGMMKQLPDSIQQSLFLVAGFWLLWLAYKTWPKRKLIPEGKGPIIVQFPGFKEGFINNILNAKATAFLLAIFLPYTGNEYPDWWPWALSVMVILEAFVGWILWAWILKKLGFEKILRKWGEIIDQILSILLGFLGVSVVIKTLLMFYR